MRKAIAILASTVVVLSACSSMDESQRKTAQTTGIGAAAGAAVGALAGGRSGAAIGAAVGGLGGYVWSQHMETQRKQIETATQGTGVEVQKTQDNRLKVLIPGDVSFDPGRADIKPNFRPVLDQFAQSLVQNPGSVIQIIGHTDAELAPAKQATITRHQALCAPQL